MNKIFALWFLFFACGVLWADTNITTNITVSTTWDLAGSPYIINGTRLVSGVGNPLLTVDPGVVIKFNANAYLQIGQGSTTHGRLQINGSSDSPVLITANTATPSPGFWGSIKTTAYCDLASLQYAILEYGGSASGLFETGGGSPLLQNCVFRYSAVNGIHSTSSTSGPTVSSCSFENNAGYPIQTNATHAHLLGTGNLFTANGISSILINSVTLNSGATWLNQGLPYELDDNQYLYTGTAPLVLGAGVELLFGSAKKLYVGGSVSGNTGCIDASGAIFGSVDPGNPWNGIEVLTYCAPSSFQNCTVRDVGSTGSAAFYIRGNNLTEVSGCTVLNCNTWGLLSSTGAAFSWSGNTITGCSKTVSLHPNDIRKLGAGNQYTFNTDNWINCSTGTISVTCNWVPQTIPVRLAGDVTIFSSGGCKLTLPYGVIMEFNTGTRLVIGYSGSPGTFGALSATGTLFRGASSGAGVWKGLYFDVYVGDSILSACSVSDAGYSNLAAVTIANNLTTITGCSIFNNLARGIYVTNGKHAGISANEISSCGSYPLSVDTNGVNYVMANNVMTGNNIDKVELNAETVTSNCTWRNLGIPYLLTGTVNVFDSLNPRLSILPGTIVMLQNSNSLAIGYSGSSANSGSLQATGVTFTRNNAGDVPVGLVFQTYMADANTFLDGCIIEYFRNTAQGTAVWCNNASPSFIGCTFRNNPGHGVGGGTSSHFRVENCSFQDNGGYPIKTTAEAFSFVSGSGNSFSGNNPDRILISGGTLSSSSVWNNPGIPVEVSSNISIFGESSPIITINSGLHLLFQTGVGFQVGYAGSPVYSGALQATGAYFSALNGTTGGWTGLSFQTYMSMDSYLRYCTIEHGGANGCIYLNNAPLPEIFNCIIRYGTIGIKLSGANSTPHIWRNHIVSNGSGIVCSTNANPLIGGSLGYANAISANTGLGVSNTTTGITVNAEYNWWGDPAGPNGPLGDGVSSYVDYDPWRDTEIGEAPGPFSLLNPQNMQVLSTLTPLLDWEDAVDPTIGDVITYTLEINISPSFSVGGWVISGIPSSIYNLGTGYLADNTRYFWRVTAYDSGGQNTFCNEAYFYFDVAIPEAPGPFSLVSPAFDASLAYTSNLLSWQPAIDPDLGDTVTYHVLVDVTAGFENASTLTSTETQVYSDFCIPGTLYYWQVVATDTQEHSTYSEIKRFYVLPDALPRTPSWLNANVNGSDLILSWEAIPGAESYLLFSSDDPYGTFTDLGSPTGAGYTDVGGANQTRKFYKVKAVDSY